MKKLCKRKCNKNHFLILFASLIVIVVLVSVAVSFITKTTDEDIEDAEEYIIEEIDGEFYISPGPGMATPTSPPNIPPPTSPPPGN